MRPDEITAETRAINENSFTRLQTVGLASTRSPSSEWIDSLRLTLSVLLLLEGFLQILPGFVERALGVVVGLDGLAVFVGGALALSGDVEDLA